MVRAAKLDANLYEEVEADTSATGQAATVVVLASVATGIGAIAEGGVLGLVTGTAVALVAWYIWAFITFFVGTRFLPEPETKADMGELLRTIGFSSSPGVLRIFGFVPMVGPIIVLLASIWMLVAMVVAVRQALDYTSTGRAIGVCIIGWVVQLIFLVLAGMLVALITGAGQSAG